MDNNPNYDIQVICRKDVLTTIGAAHKIAKETEQTVTILMTLNACAFLDLKLYVRPNSNVQDIYKIFQLECEIRELKKMMSTCTKQYERK